MPPLLQTDEFCVALTAFGPEDNTWGLAAIDSLRTHGRYDGSVRVFTDAPKSYQSLKRVTTVATPDISPGESRHGYRARLLCQLKNMHVLSLDVRTLCSGPLLELKRYIDGCDNDRTVHLFTTAGSDGVVRPTDLIFIAKNGAELCKRWQAGIDPAAEAGSGSATMLGEGLFAVADDAFLAGDGRAVFVSFAHTRGQSGFCRTKVRNYIVNVLALKHLPAGTWPEVVTDYARRIASNNKRWIGDARYLRYDGQNKLANKEIAVDAGCKVPETYAVLTSAAEFDPRRLPSSYVVKPSHLAGGNCVFFVRHGADINTGKKIDYDELRSKLAAALNTSQSGRHREYVASHVPPRIIVEELLLDANGCRFPDYEFTVFHGKLLFLAVFTRDSTGKVIRRQLYNKDWQRIDFDCIHPGWRNSEQDEPAPRLFPEAVYWAEKLSQESGLVSLRSSFKLCERGVYFGEFTINPGGGSIFTPWMNLYMGLLWEYPEIVGKLRFSPASFSVENKWRVLNTLLSDIELKEKIRSRLSEFFRNGQP